MNWMFKVVPVFIIFVFIVVISWLVLVGTVATKAVGEVRENGLKSIIEQVWEGAPKE